MEWAGRFQEVTYVGKAGWELCSGAWLEQFGLEAANSRGMCQLILENCTRILGY